MIQDLIAWGCCGVWVIVLVLMLIWHFKSNDENDTNE